MIAILLTAHGFAAPIHECAAASVYDCLSYTDCRVCSKPDAPSKCIEPDDMAKYLAAGYRCLATAAPTSPRFVASPTYTATLTVNAGSVVRAAGASVTKKLNLKDLAGSSSIDAGSVKMTVPYRKPRQSTPAAALRGRL